MPQPIPYSEQDRKTMIQLWRAGKSYSEIGSAIGRTHHGVKMQIYLYKKKKNLIVPREQHLAPILLATKRNAKWTNEDEQRLRDLKRIGVSIDDIAQDLRRTVAAVKKRWESLNKSNVNQSNESNRSTASSRRGGKRRRSDNNSMVSKSRQKWTDEDVQRLRRMKESGISYEEIGRVLHRSVKGVQNKWLNVNKDNTETERSRKRAKRTHRRHHSNSHTTEESEDDEDSDLEIVESDDSEEEEELDENEDSDSDETIGGELTSAEECLSWLQSIGYGHYVSKLRRRWVEDEMDGKTLRLLNVQDLKEYGIKAMYDRKMIIQAIGELQ